jgi:cadmium resistance transport/sequestration family protein
VDSQALDSPLVENVVGTIGAAAGVFAGTDVDDLIVLTVLFLSARAHGVPRRRQIWAGQYAGIAVLVAVSAAAALGLAVVPDRWVGLAGLIPFAMGVKGLVDAIRSRGSQEAPGPVASGAVAVAAVTIANGADNLSVYTPMFRTIGVVASLLTVAVFAAGVAVWCLAAAWLGSHQRIIEVVRRFGHWIVPLVFMTIGAVIVIESGALSLLPPGR